jgi:hypothetical protein
MKRRLWAGAFVAACGLAASYPLAAQPKNVVNAKVDTRSASGGVDRIVHELISAQPQPAWIGYEVPSVRSWSLGCEYVYNDGNTQRGVVHLEPPDHALILIRVDENAVSRIRYVSPDCEIDGGAAPLHWLTDVQPEQSVAMLAGLAAGHDPGSGNAVGAIAMHATPAADSALEKFLGTDQPESSRLRVVTWLGSDRGPHGFDVLRGLIEKDPDERVRERAVSTLASSRDPRALPLLIETARNSPNPKVRSQAIGDLGRKPAASVLPVLKDAIDKDSDPQVQRRAISTLQSMPDGAGIPLLIQLATAEKDMQLRKQAMNSLQSSRDPRALEFFEKVLK